MVVEASAFKIKFSNPDIRVFFLSAGNVSEKSSLFTYDSKYLLDNYYTPPSRDPAYVPAFFLPNASLEAAVLTMCLGEGGEFCKYDTLITQSIAKGNATLSAYQSHLAKVAALGPGTV